MRQRLKCLLALLENDSVEHLVHGFLTLDHHRHGFDGLMVAMFNASEGQLECLHLSDANRRATVKLEADIEDTNHPLVRVLRNGAPEVWYALNRGVRIEDDGFRGFIEALPNGCSMYGVPLFDFQGRACGVIAVFAEDIDRFVDSRGMFSIYCQIFQHRLNKLQEVEHLRSQLVQLRSMFKVREKQLDELMISLSTSDVSTSPELSRDYSKIDDLSSAVEAFEAAVLTQRQRLYGNDKNRIADSLGITPRTLGYKLAKYRC
ncbi:Fis family transcriptional regulator [Serratia sp. 3ACOL1]|uniref:helix-turn-helix domain-containing protein n=1 Tax=Serratia sp. 3ACOL1 TaxID=2448483 RepID=UPI000EF4B010|nr:helix-turn-helix domain-containing protein [Serratia sp. 3ACOL1]AYM89871.1 Fis family transcriptional regulator [Serratia sp. 3ACOL1]